MQAVDVCFSIESILIFVKFDDISRCNFIPSMKQLQYLFSRDINDIYELWKVDLCQSSVTFHVTLVLSCIKYLFTLKCL